MNNINIADLYKDGFYGQFGGAYIPELLYPNVTELKDNYLDIINSESFQKEFDCLVVE